MKWPLVFHVDSLPGTVRGRAIGPFIQIRKVYKNDYGLYQHELEHVKQAFLGLFIIHGLLYLFSSKYKLWSEVQAFKKQASYYEDDRIPLFALAIATRYKLDVSVAEAERLLRK